MTSGIIVQARMSSARLPGKVLMPLGGEPALTRLMERLDRVQSVQRRLVATSVAASDDPIAELCRMQGFESFRGPLEDALERFHMAAGKAGLDVIVRVTADCPLLDPALVDECLAVYLESAGAVDYVSNADGTFPDGLDVEVFSRSALDTASLQATSSADREHVTPYILRNFRKRMIGQIVRLGDLRWTIDYPQDYDAVASIFDELYPVHPAFDTTDIYRLLLRKPELVHVDPDLVLDRPKAKSLLKDIARQVEINEQKARQVRGFK